MLERDHEDLNEYVNDQLSKGHDTQGTSENVMSTELVGRFSNGEVP